MQITTARRTMGSSNTARSRGTGDSAPSTAQATSAGAGSSSTASKHAGHDEHVAIVPSSAHAASRSSGVAGVAEGAQAVGDEREQGESEQHERRWCPRSDRNVIQSLLGHGFDVIPSSDSDGSSADANFG